MSARRYSFFLSALLAVRPLGAASPNPQQFSLHFTDTDARDQAQLLLVDRTGNFFTVSTIQTAISPSSLTHIRITKTDGSGNVLATFDFGGSSMDVPYSAALDPKGNIIVAGQTFSTDFPLVTPLQSTGGAFVTKVDAGLTKILSRGTDQRS